MLTDITLKCDMVQAEGVCAKSDPKFIKFKTDLNETAGHIQCRCSETYRDLGAEPDPLEDKHPESHQILLLSEVVYRK